MLHCWVHCSMPLSCFSSLKKTSWQKVTRLLLGTFNTTGCCDVFVFGR